MRNLTIKPFLAAMLLLLGSNIMAQGILNRVKQKVEDKIVNEIFKDKDQSQQQSANPAESPTSTPSATNRKVGGLSNQDIDVPQYIADANTAFRAKEYANSRAAARQAMWGIELEIGRNLLKSLPDIVAGLDADKEQDKVISSGIGFVGLVMERSYTGKKDDKELEIFVRTDPDPLTMTMMNMAGNYRTSENMNQKSIRFQNINATITFDHNEGYALTLTAGQSTFVQINGVNFDSEKDFMAAANSFNIDSIKKGLGDQ